MTKPIFRVLLTSAFALVFAVAGALAQHVAQGSSDQTAAPMAQATASPAKNRTRGRRTQTPKTKTPSAATTAASESTDQKAPDDQKTPASTSESVVSATDPAPETEPKVDSTPEVTPKPKTEVALTPDERLRQQLQVVEQMVAAGQKQEALTELQSLSAEDRFDPQGFYNIANAFARLEATDAAINTYRKAIEQRKGHYSRASNNLGVVLMRQGFLDQALEAFLSALRDENFRYAEASYNLGRLYAARGEMDRATHEWRRALQVDPKHTAAARSLGGGNTAASTAPVKTALVTRPASRETATPVASAANTFSLDRESYSYLQRGRSAHERGRYEEAAASYRRVLSRKNGYFYPANLELSFSLIELRRNDEAIAALLPITQKDGARYPLSYYHLARLYEVRGNLKEAEDYYTRAAETYRGENAQFLLAVSSVREKRGNFSGALSALEQYVNRKQQQGQKPDWADDRLAKLRQKLAASQNQPKQ